MSLRNLVNALVSKGVVSFPTHHGLLEYILVRVAIAVATTWVCCLEYDVSVLSNCIAQILLCHCIERLPVSTATIETLARGTFANFVEADRSTIELGIEVVAHVCTTGLIATHPQADTAYKTFCISAVEVTLVNAAALARTEHDGDDALQVFQNELCYRVAVGQMGCHLTGFNLECNVTIMTYEFIITGSSHADCLAVNLGENGRCTRHHLLEVCFLLHAVDDGVALTDDTIEVSPGGFVHAISEGVDVLSTTGSIVAVYISVEVRRHPTVQL